MDFSHTYAHTVWHIERPNSVP